MTSIAAAISLRSKSRKDLYRSYAISRARCDKSRYRGNSNSTM